MPIIQENKTTKQLFVTIPKDKAKMKKWKKGTLLTDSFNERGNLEYAEVVE